MRWGADAGIISGAASVQGAIAVSVGVDIGTGGYAGFDVACAMLDTGRATCWGDSSAANASNGPANSTGLGVTRTPAVTPQPTSSLRCVQPATAPSRTGSSSEHPHVS